MMMPAHLVGPFNNGCERSCSVTLLNYWSVWMCDSGDSLRYLSALTHTAVKSLDLTAAVKLLWAATARSETVTLKRRVINEQITDKLSESWVSTPSVHLPQIQTHPAATERHHRPRRVVIVSLLARCLVSTSSWAAGCVQVQHSV